MAVAAAVDESNLGVDSFQSAVGESVLDGVDDSFEVVSDPAGQVLEGPQLAALGGSASSPEIVSCHLGFYQPIEVAEPFFHIPGSPELVAAAPELVEELALPSPSFSAPARRA